MPTKNLHLSVSRSGKYVFRARWPTSIARLLQRSEFKIPLKTDSRSTAIKKAAGVNAVYQGILSMYEDIEEADVTEEMLAEMRTRVRTAEAQAKTMEAEAKKLSLSSLRASQFISTWQLLKAFASDEVLESYGLSADDKNALYQRVIAEASFYDDATRRDINHLTMTTADKELLLEQFKSVVHDITQKHISQIAQYKISHLPHKKELLAPSKNHSFQDLHNLDKLDPGTVSKAKQKKTDLEYSRYARAFDVLVQNKPVNLLTQKELSEVFVDLSNIKVRGISIIELGDTTKKIAKSDLIAGTSENKIGSATAEKYSTRLISLLKLAHNDGITEYTPDSIKKPSFSAIRTRQKMESSHIDDKKSSFTPEEIQRIFSGYLYNTHESCPTNGIFKYQYWLPLIALHTAARISEISQLNTDDICELNGIYCFKIEGDSDSVSQRRSLKNIASKRLVPVHKKLIELGLLIYVQERKTEKKKKLFDGLVYSENNKWGATATQFFCRLDGPGGYLSKVGVHKSQNDGKKFHSFRHTVITELRDHILKNNEQRGYIIETITGHEKEKTSEADRYGTSNLQTKKDFLNNLNFKIDVMTYDQFCKKFRGILIRSLKSFEQKQKTLAAKEVKSGHKHQ